MCGETFIIFTFASNVFKQGKRTNKKGFQELRASWNWDLREKRQAKLDYDYSPKKKN